LHQLKNKLKTGLLAKYCDYLYYLLVLGVDSVMHIKKALLDINILDEFYDVVKCVEKIYFIFIKENMEQYNHLKSYIFNFTKNNPSLEALILYIQSTYYNYILYADKNLNKNIDFSLRAKQFGSLVFYKRKNFLIKL